MKKTLLQLIFVLALVLNYSIIRAQPSSFKAHGLGGGGAFYCPVVNPNNNREMFVTTDMSDLYHSTDGGNSWTISNFTCFISAGGLSQVEFTNQANTLYSLCQNVVSEANIPVVSTDDGKTWTPLAKDPSGGNGVYYVIANPRSSTQLIVSDYSNLYLSNDGGKTFGNAFYTDTTGNGVAVAGTFFDGLNIYLCTQEGLLVSPDGGNTWSKPTKPGIDISGVEDILSFAGSKSGNTTRFFCITQSVGSVYLPVSPGNFSSYANVYSLDYGGSWVQKVNGIISGDYPFFVKMADGNINQAYIGGSSGNSGTPIALKTTDAGSSWNYIFNTGNNQNIQTGYYGYKGDIPWYWGSDCFGFNVCSGDSNTVMITDMGFVHKSTDGGATWQGVYVPQANLNPVNQPTPDGLFYPGNGLENTSCWQMMWYDSLHLFAGYSDVYAIRSTDGGNTWSHGLSTPSQYNCNYYFLKNPANGILYGATSNAHDMYASTYLQDNRIDDQGGSIIFSTDTGKTFQILHDFKTPVIWLALDPATPNRMYASVINASGLTSPGGIYICNDIQDNASSTWTLCSSPPRTQGHPLNIRVLDDGSILCSFSGRRNPAGAFTNSSGVFLSTNQGSSWTDVSDPGMDYWTMDVVIDPNDATQNTWWACAFSGWGGNANNKGGLYRTTNRGENWTKLVNVLNNNVGDTTAIFSISFDPVNKGAAYMSAQPGGVYYCADAEASSPVFTQLIAYPFNQPNRVFFNPYNPSDVWVASFGNGLEMGSLNSKTTGIQSIQTSNDYTGTIQVYPNPGSGIFNLQLTIPDISRQIRFQLFNALGQELQEQTFYNVQGSIVRQVDMSSCNKGMYLIQAIDEKGKVYTSRVVIE